MTRVEVYVTIEPCLIDGSELGIGIVHSAARHLGSRMAMPPNIADGFRKQLVDWVKAAGWPDPKAVYLEAEMRYYTAVYKEIQELGEEWALKKKRVSVIDFRGGTVVGLPKILRIGN